MSQISGNTWKHLLVKCYTLVKSSTEGVRITIKLFQPNQAFQNCRPCNQLAADSSFSKLLSDLKVTLSTITRSRIRDFVAWLNANGACFSFQASDHTTVMNVASLLSTSTIWSNTSASTAGRNLTNATNVAKGSLIQVSEYLEALCNFQIIAMIFEM